MYSIYIILLAEMQSQCVFTANLQGLSYSIAQQVDIK